MFSKFNTQIQMGGNRHQQDVKLPQNKGLQVMYLMKNIGCFIFSQFKLSVITFRKLKYIITKHLTDNLTFLGNVITPNRSGMR